MAAENIAWLNAPYMEKVLRNSEKNDSIKVTDLILKPATATGDNYMSTMHRASVKFSRVQNGDVIHDTKSILIKVVPEGAREDLLESTGYFKTEMFIMADVLPRMNQMLENVGLTPLSAQCFHLQFEKPTHIVMEDLTPRGFQMAEYKSLDLDHYILALRNLGKFHGATVALAEKDPEAVTKYKIGMFHMDNLQTVGQVYRSGAKCIASVAAKWPELSPRIVEKLQKLPDVLYKKCCESLAYQENDFNVLNHGDYWINNMMFQYDDHKKPIDYLFVDFQLCNYGSPAIDVLHFLGSSVKENIRFQHREQLLHEYYDSLTSTMTKLKCSTKAPSFLHLEVSLKNRGFCELVTTMLIMGPLIFDENIKLGFDDFVKANESGNNPVFNGKEYRRVMTKLLPIYDSMGLLDI